MSKKLLIAAIKGTDNIENDGVIVRFSTGASMDTLRSLIADKLGIATGYQDLILEDDNGKVLSGIDHARQQQVIYVNLKNQVKLPAVPKHTLPYFGNLYDMLPDIQASWRRLFEEYGPVVKVNMLGSEMIGTNDPAVAELFVKESEYFTKKIYGGLSEVKAFGGQGLFTTNSDDMDWKLAHELLMPAFSPRAIKAYQLEMSLIGQTTIKLLEQFSPDESVEILHWTTNLTFETIGKVGFGYDFHLLDDRNAKNHPFIEAMGYCMKQSFTRMMQAKVMKYLPVESNRRFEESLKLMHTIVDDVIRQRKNGPEAKEKDKDLLGFMLNARDENDLGLTDKNIRDQVITFLIAGHETTSNTLAWTLYELSRHPEIEEKILQEIVNLGITHDGLPTSEQSSGMKYTYQVLKETLRMYSPLRALGKYCKKDIVVPGGYQIKEGDHVNVDLNALHHNPKIYPNPDEFDPSRWTPEEEQKRSRFAWLPFSTGPRACIGMALALQEAKTILGMLLHRFRFVYDGPPITYDPKAATIRPFNLFMKILPREHLPSPTADSRLTPPGSPAQTKIPQAAMPTAATNVGTVPLPPVTFLFGTQTGTAQDYASQLAGQAKSFGFKNIKVCDMDKWEVLESGKYNGPKGSNDPRELVVICTATYNGSPPDSAEKFDKFISDTSKDKDHPMEGLLYTVFGLGNKNWRTYQQFPIKCDNRLDELGAERFFDLGSGDADKDMDADFHEWCAHFWFHTLKYFGVATNSEPTSLVPSPSKSEDPADKLEIQFIQISEAAKWNNASKNINGEYSAEITANSELQNVELSKRSTRLIEIDISKLQSPDTDKHRYLAGDHLEILPENSDVDVEKVALGFGFILDSVFEITNVDITTVSSRSLAATIKGPCTVRNALKYYADIYSAPSRYLLAYFAARLQKTHPDVAATFSDVIIPGDKGQAAYTEFVKKHRNLLDLQRNYPLTEFRLKEFLCAVTVMQPRRYSIASSPLKNKDCAHLAVGVVDDVLNNRHCPGLTSGYLAKVHLPCPLRARIKSSKSSFCLPSDEKTPIIMIAAGTGVSPFVGFLQEREVLKSNAEAHLFFGCRHPDQDFIYRDVFEGYEKTGVITKLYPAFSRYGEDNPRKYVQHQIMANAGAIWKLLSQGAVIYVCGAGIMSRDVRRTFELMAKSFGGAKTDEEATKLLNDLMSSGRYNEDVWG
ncbi:cytochrome P450, partial [Umbelopsis sp. AD052]